MGIEVNFSDFAHFPSYVYRELTIGGSYVHLKPGSITVEQGEFVSKGQVIAKLGNTGNSGAPHMHLHIMETALGFKWTAARI